ncbi:MAG: hypothetical protein HKN23_16810 [Verrucomicrobiales bacterium]|nr:hypothetical protein [Verrucomicrobiales bacterium]
MKLFPALPVLAALLLGTVSCTTTKSVAELRVFATKKKVNVPVYLYRGTADGYHYLRVQNGFSSKEVKVPVNELRVPREFSYAPDQPGVIYNSIDATNTLSHNVDVKINTRSVGFELRTGI